MVNKLFIIRSILFFVLKGLILQYSYSQENDSLKGKDSDDSEDIKYSKDMLAFEVNRESWTSWPADVKLNPVNMGINISYCNELFNKYSHVNLSLGIGMGVQNIQSNSFLIRNSAGISYFSKIPDSLQYRTNKLSTTFIEIPIEFRFKTQPGNHSRRFKFFTGFRVGYNIQRYLKYEGEDYRAYGDGSKVKFKEYKVNNILQYRYGIYCRIGYGQVCLTAYYSLTPLFIEGKGPDITPYSVGIAFIPF